MLVAYDSEFALAGPTARARLLPLGVGAKRKGSAALRRYALAQACAHGRGALDTEAFIDATDIARYTLPCVGLRRSKCAPLALLFWNAAKVLLRVRALQTGCHS